MNENYRLTKEYKISKDIFREGYRAYQKKYVYPKSYVFMGIFILLAADFVHAAVKSPDNFMAYILIVLCLSMVFREWYNPRKIRRNLVDSYGELENTVYRASFADDHIMIETVSEVTVTDENEEPEPLPEPVKIPKDEKFHFHEYDDFAVIDYGKAMVYIIPKKDFSEDDIKIMRECSILNS